MTWIMREHEIERNIQVGPLGVLDGSSYRSMVGENTMGNKDGYTLERICAGSQQNVARFEIVRIKGFTLQRQHIVANTVIILYFFFHTLAHRLALHKAIHIITFKQKKSTLKTTIE